MKRIANKVSLAIILSTVLMGLILGALIYIRSETMLTKEVENNLVLLLEKEANVIEIEFERVENLSEVLRMIVLNTIDVENAKQDPQYMNEYKEEVANLITSSIKTFDNKSGWVLFNSNSIPGMNTLSYTYEYNQFIREPEYDVIRDGYGDEDWWVRAIEDGYYWTQPYYWRPWESDIITYSIPIIVNEEIIAVTGAELFLEPFVVKLDQINFNNYGKVALISNDTTWVYKPESEQGDFSQEWLDKNLETLTNEASGVRYEITGQDRRVFAWTTLNNGWILITKPSYKNVFGELKDLFNITLLTMVLSIPFTIAIGVFLSKSLTSRIALLSDVADNILNHDKLIMLPIKSDDEIGHLTEVFNQMQLEVRATLTKLKNSESKYRTLIESSDQMIYTIDLSGNFVMINTYMEEYLNIKREDVIHKAFTNLFTKEDTKVFWINAFEEVVQKDKKITKNFELDLEPLGKRTLTTSLIPLKNESGQLVMIMGTSTDITIIVDAQNEITRLLEKDKYELTERVEEKAVELEKAMKELMVAEKMASLGRLVAGVAHEINTPLGTAITAASFLEETQNQLQNDLIEGKLSKKSFEHALDLMTEALSSLLRNLTKAATLVTSFKNISVQQSSNALTTFSLKDLIEIEFISLKHELKHINPKIIIECNEAIFMKSYPGAITQILTNLIFNSIKHGLIHVENPQIKVEVYDLKDSIQLLYSDNGVGMDNHTINHIFEPFFTTKRGEGGSGLGLSIVYNLITTLLKGKISCESNPMAGTIFTIIIKKEVDS